jgi:methylated-DNA-[protein]-cysteine S-methyltransferase
MKYCFTETPAGRLLLAADDEALHQLQFPNHHKVGDGWIETAPRGPLADTVKQLREYFDGQRTEFDLPLAPKGTEFQHKVWRQLQAIPYGQKISYRELAHRVDNPKGFRAVGSANGKNPIAIIIPCHRVIAADGTLGGFGGGLPTKEKLLALEYSVVTAKDAHAASR